MCISSLMGIADHFRSFETNYLEVNEASAEVGNSSHPRLHSQAL